jgi:hypothetical protein
VTLPDSHTPMSRELESRFYPDDQSIIKAVRACRA